MLTSQNSTYFPSARAIHEIFSHFGPVSNVTPLPLIGESLSVILAFDHKVSADALINSNGMSLGGKPIFTRPLIARSQAWYHCGQNTTQAHNVMSRGNLNLVQRVQNTGAQFDEIWKTSSVSSSWQPRSTDNRFAGLGNGTHFRQAYLPELKYNYKTHEPAPAVNDIKLDQIQFDPFKDETIEADTSGVKLNPDIPPFVPAANTKNDDPSPPNLPLGRPEAASCNQDRTYQTASHDGEDFKLKSP